MNRTDRLLAIVLELQAKKQRRAEDLAATFETSKRTIYRDIQALCEAGVPVVAMPGQGYSLSEGYFLPPLTFSSDEAVMLLLGTDFVAQNFDQQYAAAAQTASRKIEAVLPEHLRPEVRKLQASIRFIASNALSDPAEPQTLRQLRRAILEQHTIAFRYHARSSSDGAGVESARSADPYALVHIDEAWYLVAYCHLRRGMRNFRLERIDGLRISSKTFVRAADFRLRETHDNTRNITVKVLFNLEVARWVQESRFFYITETEERPEGLLATLTVRRESDVLQWLLGWGTRVRILEPDSLRERLLHEAKALIAGYEKGEHL